jgi:hypothetical protein
MKNVVLWGIQSTVDRTYYVEKRMQEVLGAFIKMGLFEETHEVLKPLLTGRQVKDNTFNLKLDNPKNREDIQVARKYLQEQGYRKTEQIGGDPAIAALRAHHLRGGSDSSPLPHVRYVGLLPASVRDFIRKQGKEARQELEQVFNPDNCVEIDAEPETLAIEAEFKNIFSYGPGRTVNDLAPSGDFTEFLAKLKQAAGRPAQGRVVVAVSIPRPLDSGAAMLAKIRDTFSQTGSIFLAIKSFRTKTGELDNKLAQEVSDLLLPKVQVFSLNEAELHDLHTAVVDRKGDYKDISLPNKLKDIDCQAIKVCHSADGAILEASCDPQRILSSRNLTEKPGEFLRESLQLATDGAAYAIDSVGETGRSASESMVRIYSSSVEDRSKDQFRVTFLKTVERLPSGIIASQAPLVARHLAAVTGVGAMFDGLLLSFLMRD